MAQPTRRSKRTEALELAKSVRSDLYAGNKHLNLILLQCRTICKYLDRLEVNEWIELELDGYYDKYKTNKEFIENLPTYRRQSPNFYIAQNRQLVPLPYSIMETYAKNLAIGEPIAQVETSPIFTIVSGTILDELNKNLNKMLKDSGQSLYGDVTCYAQFADNHLKAVVAGVRKRIADFIDEIILELEYGEIPEEIFLTLRAEVDQKLANLSPTAIEKLKNAYEKVGTSGSTEDWTHVATTCRRVIKDVADAVFLAQDTPQKDRNGKEHVVDDSHVINRIIAGINADLGKGKNRIFRVHDKVC